MGFRTMVNGTAAYCENEEMLNLLNDIFQNQMDFEAKAKFKVGEQVKISASLPELIDYYMEDGVYSYVGAKREALLLLSQENVTVIGAMPDVNGVFYTMESEDISMIFLPERFLQKTRESSLTQNLHEYER